MLEYRLEHIMSYKITVTFPEIIGPTPDGLRLNFYVTSGEITGPRVSGHVHPAGGDWMLVRPDGVGIIDIRATLETDDGALIYAVIGGTFDFGENGYQHILNGGQPSMGAHFRTWPRFHTAHPDYLWLNRMHCLGIGAAFTEELRHENDIYAVI